MYNEREERPILTIALSKTDRLLEIFSFFFFLLLWIVCIAELIYFPDIISVHFDFAGKPDNYGSKYTLLILPIIISFVFALFSFLCKRPHIFNYPSKITKDNAVKQYSVATQMLRALKLGITFFCNVILVVVYFTVEKININFGYWLLPLLICCVLLPTFYYVAKLLKIK